MIGPLCLVVHGLGHNDAEDGQAGRGDNEERQVREGNGNKEVGWAGVDDNEDGHAGAGDIDEEDRRAWSDDKEHGQGWKR